MQYFKDFLKYNFWQQLTCYVFDDNTLLKSALFSVTKFSLIHQHTDSPPYCDWEYPNAIGLFTTESVSYLQLLFFSYLTGGKN